MVIVVVVFVLLFYEICWIDVLVLWVLFVWGVVFLFGGVVMMLMWMLWCGNVVCVMLLLFFVLLLVVL